MAAPDGYNNNNNITAHLHLYFFGVILFLMLAFSCYINYDSMFVHLVSQLKLCVMLSPLVLLLFLHFLSSEDGQRLSSLFAVPEQDSFHRAGGSPWGVAAVLVLLAVMIFYHSSFIDRWFPLQFAL